MLITRAIKCYAKNLAPNILDLDPIRICVSQAELARNFDIISHVPDGREIGDNAPLLQPFQGNSIERDRVSAGVKRCVMHRIVRLRLRTSRILGDQAVHQIQHYSLCDQRTAINFRDAPRAKAEALRKTPPVVYIRYRHIIEATSNAVGFAAAHHRDIDDLCDFGRKDTRKMAQVAGVFRIRKKRHLPFVTLVLEIAPNQFPDQRRGKNRLGIVAIARRNGFQLITTGFCPITGVLDSAQGSIPHDNAASRMSGRGQTVNDRVDDVMVGRKKFAADRGDLNSNLVIWSYQRRPCSGHVRLPSGRENEPIHHRVHHSRTGLVIPDRIRIVHRVNDGLSGRWLRCLPKREGNGAEKNKGYVSHRRCSFQDDDELMSQCANHNSATIAALYQRRKLLNDGGHRPPLQIDPIRHLYLHIPFCARICPYCAFYKELLDRSQTERFCAAILSELELHMQDRHLLPSTIYFGGGTPSALTTSQLELLLGGFRERLDLSALSEWTVEANPGSVSARKAALLREFGVNRISLGVQSWDEKLLKILGREHTGPQAKSSFSILRAAGFTNINVDLMFGLPGQSMAQWRSTLEKTIGLQPEHISAYCLTYEEDTEFFLRQKRGELHADPDVDAGFFEMTMSILENAGYEHYEISNYARAGFSSAHNRAYWAGEDYLGLGPSAFSTRGLRRWQNVSDYRNYADRTLSGESAIATTEQLTPEMKRAERIAFSLRTGEGIPRELLQPWPKETQEFVALGLLRQSNGNFTLTTAGKSLADSVAEAFV